MPLFDAVAYTPATARLAREYCKCLPEEEKIRRKRRFGWRRHSINKPFDGYMMSPDIYGSAELTPEDFEWREMGPSLSVGTVKAEALKRIEPGAQVEREREVKELEADEERKKEQRQSNSAIIEQWNDSKIQARLLYLYAVADMAGVKDPEKLPIERLMSIKAAANVPIIDENEFINKVCGPQPDVEEVNEQGVSALPEEIKNDFDKYMDHVYSLYVQPRKDTVMKG